MKKLLILMLLAVPCMAQSTSTARRVVGGTTLPATCRATSPVDVFIDTDATTTARWYVCTSTNTWTVQGGVGGGDAFTANPLSQFASTTSAQLAGVISNETGTNLLVYNTSPVIVTPRITTSINDANGNEVIITPATASAVNEVTITNAATGNAPSITASGGDTNVGLAIASKGAGAVVIGSNTSNVQIGDTAIAGNGTILSVADASSTIELRASGVSATQGIKLSNQVPSGLLYVNANSIIKTHVMTDGQLVVGSTGADPVKATLTGTANQVTVTNGAGSITLSIPTNPTLPGTTTGTFSGNLTGNASTVTTNANLTGPVTSAGNATTITNNSVTGAMIALGSDAQGDVMYYNGTDYVRLAAGTSGQFLKTLGAGANPAWDTPAGSGTINSGVTNIIPKYTASTTLDDSLLSDDGTTATYTGTGGVSAVGFTGTGAASGGMLLNGLTSGGAAFVALDVAGTAIAYALPSTNGAANQFLMENGSITCPTLATGMPATCHGLVWTGSTGTGNVVRATSPQVTTSITTDSTTFALLNTTATTVNAFGAATTVNTGASATQIWNFGGSTTASEFRFLEPSGSGTNYSAFKSVAQSANITYSLPATVGGAGTFLRDVAGNGVLDWATPGGSGTVTATGGSLTSNAVVLGAGTTDTKVVAGIITDGTSKLTLGVAGASVGSVDFKNATSGTITLAPVTGALGTVTLSMPATTGTLALVSQLPAAASETVSGIIEVATAAETTTGTDAARAVSPDGLAGSTIFGTKTVQLIPFDFATTTATGDGKFYFLIPPGLNGMNLVGISGNVVTAGTTGTINVDVARCAAAATGNVCSGTVSDVLSTNLTIDSAENDSATAAAAAVIDTGQDDVATGQLYRIDVDAVHTTPAVGLIVNLVFQLP